VPADVSASVLSNTQLSSQYNVIALAAPEIAERALPGQFVMVKTGDRLEPLLRRPFSVFEVLKDTGRVVGLSLLSKRIGPSTTLLFDARPGDRVQCLGPLGRPFAPVSAPDAAWLVAGGVGLAPFATLAETLHRRSVAVRLYYGARRAAELFYLDWFERLGAELVLTTEDGSRGEKGRVTLPLDRPQAAAVERTDDLRVRLTMLPPSRDCQRRTAGHVGYLSARHGLQRRRLLRLSSIRLRAERRITCARASQDPCSG
jgi:dihydroorotate dehydrogenase electron transfer subunit